MKEPQIKKRHEHYGLVFFSGVLLVGGIDKNSGRTEVRQ